MLKVRLVDVCRPRQWPTLSKSEMSSSGHPVYGANGKIGFSDAYTHSEPVLLIGCRGSCGTLHITEPKSYANGNAMALDDLNAEVVDIRFLYHQLGHRGFDDVITGSSQPQITQGGLAKIELSLPPVPVQRRIAATLDKADNLRRKRQEAIGLADEFLRAAFLNLVGDPVANSRDWPERSVSEIGIVTTGNTPDRSVDANFGNAIEWIKSDNINTPSHWLTTAREGLSTQGMKLARIVPEGATLMTCIAGSPSCIGNVAMADRRVAFNQQINAITPSADVDPKFLYLLLLFSKARIQATSTNSMKGMVSKGTLEKVRLVWPPKSLQDQLVHVFDKIATLRTRMKEAEQLNLYASLQAQLLA